MTNQEFLGEALPVASVLHGLPTDATGASAALPALSPAAGATAREAALQAENDELRGQLRSGQLNLEAAQRRLYELDRDRGYLRAMLMGARRLADVARAEHVHARATLEARAEDASAARAEMAAQIEAIRTSTSWRLIGPMRVVVRGIRRVMR
jgi:hypothetical protein